MGWVRSLDTLESRPLIGTEGATGAPFWNADSKVVVFSVPGRLRKIDISSGQPQTLCVLQTDAIGGFFTADNKIVFGGPPGLLEVPADGGTPSALTIPDRSRGEAGHLEPSLLPDGVHFLYTRYAPGSDAKGVYIGALNLKPDQQESKPLIPELTLSAFVPSNEESPAGGFVIFTRENAVVEQPFDSTRLKLSGGAVPIADQPALTVGAAPAFSVSRTGTLVYFMGGTGDRHLTWYDRRGVPTGSAWAPGVYNELALSPDGTRVAVVRDSGSSDIHIFDFAGNRSIRLTSNPLTESKPLWSPDGGEILFYSNRDTGGFFAKPSNGAGDEKLILKFDTGIGAAPNDWSGDGRFVIYAPTSSTRVNRDLWLLTMDEEHKTTKFLQTEFNELDAVFLPESQGHPRYLAYVSNESGRNEVYVRTFPDPENGKLPISSGGGYQPRWRRDGKDLLYFTGEGKLMSVDVTLTPSFKAGVPRVLFQPPIYGGGPTVNSRRWNLTPNGDRFLIITTSNDVTPIVVVVNWLSGLKK